MMFWRSLSCACLALLLGACATHDAAFVAPSGPVDARFSVEGRISVRYDGRGQLANFDWQHVEGRDVLSVNTPLGSTVARVERDASGVTLTDGKTQWHAPDVETLTQERLGWALPLSNLVWWIRGLPAPGQPFARAADGALLQEGWQIRFVADADVPSPYPRRVEMVRDGLVLTLISQRWY